MPFGLIFSSLCHAALLVWALWSMRAVQEPPAPETPMINAEIITPSEFLRLKQGAEDAKKLETKAKDEPKPDDSKNDTKKPDNAPPPPPPPPQEEVKAEPPPPAPEPPKAEPPPPPEPAPGPSPEEQKLLEKKIEEERLKAEAEAKKKAEDEAKKKAEAEAKKKAEEEARKKKLAEKKKLEDAKKKFEKIGDLLNKLPDDADKQTALLDKDPTKKGQQAAGTSVAATETGKEAGTKTGADTVLSAREQDLLAGMIKSQLHRCSKMPGGGGGVDTPVVTVEWRLKQDGSLDGEPKVINSQNTPLFQIAAEASVNAVRNCSPLNLPADKYAHWSRITWDFDWPQILGLR